jgi:hypothetical protein
MKLLIKRFRIAYRMRRLPWKIPIETVRYVSLRKPSEAAIRRGQEIVKEMNRDR